MDSPNNPPQILHQTPFPSSPNSLSVLSWNVLLPNSTDGWWVFKSYPPPCLPEDPSVPLPIPPSCPPSYTTWEERVVMIKQKINEANADVVCIQEIAEKSFEKDFEFMKELGYTEHALFRKGRFRPATYWKPEKVSLAAPPAHKDRVLVTSFTFKPNNDNNDNDINDNNNEEPPKNLSKKEKARLEREKKEKEAKNVIHVVNVHLKTGSDQARRVRQFHEGVETAFKVAKKLGHPSPSSSPLIVCGDMNALEGDAVLFFAENGSIGPEWGGEGEKKVISKEKKLSIKLRDASLEGKGVREPPNTLVVRELVSLLEGGVGGEEGKGGLSEGVAEMLGRVFGRFATGEKGGEKVMVKGDVERWLKVVNMVVGRGSEFRWAVKKMRESLEYNSSSFSPTEEDDPPADSLPDNGFLTLSSFLAIHLEELNDGGCWGVAHNLYLLGELLPNKGLYKVRFDRVYVSEGLELCCVRDVVCEEACPNEREPSDHLPVGVEVKFK